MNVFSFLTLVFLALISGVFFAIPSLRKSHNPVISAFLIAPPGCMVMLLIPALILAAWNLYFVVALVVMVLSMVLGICVIRGLSAAKRRTQRDWLNSLSEEELLRAMKTRNRTLVFVFFFLVLCGFAIKVAGPIVLYSKNPELYAQLVPCWIKVPVAKYFTFELKRIHPFQAEYQYRITFPGSETVRGLAFNTGGKVQFNVYRMQDGRFFLEDRFGNYIVDPENREVLYVTKDRKWSAPLTEDPIQTWGGFVMDGGEPEFQLNGKPVKTTALGSVLDGMEYAGQIDKDEYSSPFRAPTKAKIEKL